MISTETQFKAIWKHMSTAAVFLIKGMLYKIKGTMSTVSRKPSDLSVLWFTAHSSSQHWLFLSAVDSHLSPPLLAVVVVCLSL